MLQPSVPKHLRVLREAGFVVRKAQRSLLFLDQVLGKPELSKSYKVVMKRLCQPSQTFRFPGGTTCHLRGTKIPCSESDWQDKIENFNNFLRMFFLKRFCCR